MSLENITIPQSKYRQGLQDQISDILMEYITNDTDFTPYDFISDLRGQLYGIQDYLQSQLNRTNAIISYLNGEQDDHLFDKRKSEENM